MTTTAPLMPSELTDRDLAEIQAIVPYAPRLPFLRYLFFHVDDAVQARTFVGAFTPGHPFGVFTAAERRAGHRPSHQLHIAFTAAGLRALGIAQAALQRFPREFVEGARERALELGDTGASAPDHWECAHDDLHIAVLVYAHTAAGRDRWSNDIEAAAAGCRCVFRKDGATLESYGAQPPADALRREHFGFADGISQPRIRGCAADRADVKPQKEVAPGLFVLGHPDPTSPMNSSLTRDVLPEPQTLTRNGTYGAFRIVEQDCDGFEAFLDANVSALDPRAREALAARMVGRWKDGTALALHDRPQGGTPSNAFDYSDDPRGARCPLGAHVRRANPRSSQVLGANGAAVPLIRRGMPYGEPHMPGDGRRRGLIGLFLCASLKHQFEFILKHWINDGRFARGLAQDQKDPLVGSNAAGESRFTYPTSSGTASVSGLTSFTTTRGAAYLFFPALGGLGFLSKPLPPVSQVPAPPTPGSAAALPPKLPTDADRAQIISAGILSKVKATHRRDAHANHHGLVYAHFEVSAHIPAALKVGLFATAGPYRAWIRFSNGRVPRSLDEPFPPDFAPDARGMAIKVLDAGGERLLKDPAREQTTQDFILVNHPTFFASTLSQYLAIVSTDERDLPSRFPHVLAAFHVNASPLSTRYFSQTASALAQGRVVRYSARPIRPVEQPPLTTEEIERLVHDKASPRFLREAMQRHLDGDEAQFEFLLQVPPDPSAVSVEDPMVEWVAPWVPVARITIPRQSFVDAGRMALAERISFNPWNGRVEHEPLGTINRLRRDLYVASANIRTDSQPVTEAELRAAFGDRR